jgi:TolA-binding protein
VYVDGLVSALTANAGQLGVGAVVLYLLIYVMRHASSDRGDYRTALEAAEKRHATEIERINKEHDKEIADLRKDLADLRKQVDDLNTALDLEREQRRKAEDLAADARRLAKGEV